MSVVPNPSPEQRRRRSRLTKSERAAFLEAVAGGWSIAHAAERAGRHRRRFYEERDRDAEFAAQWDEAIERGIEVLEDELTRRAKEGWLDEEYNGAGELVRRVRRYSPALLIFSLKARKPDVYRDNAKIELAGNVRTEITGRVRHQNELTVVDLLRWAKQSGEATSQDLHHGVVNGLVAALERRGELTPENIEQINVWCREAEEPAQQMLELPPGEVPQ